MLGGSRTAPDPRPGAAAWRAPLARRWQGLGVRERRGLSFAAVVVGLALLWLVALQPAWLIVRESPRRLAELDAQLQAMQAQAAEAQALRSVAPPAAGQSAQALQAATERMGPRARLSLQGERAVLTLDGVAPGELQAWLAEARAGARARAVEARLTRGERGLGGTVVVALGVGA